MIVGTFCPPHQTCPVLGSFPCSKAREPRTWVPPSGRSFDVQALTSGRNRSRTSGLRCRPSLSNGCPRTWFPSGWAIRRELPTSTTLRSRKITSRWPLAEWGKVRMKTGDKLGMDPAMPLSEHPPAADDISLPARLLLRFYCRNGLGFRHRRPVPQPGPKRRPVCTSGRLFVVVGPVFVARRNNPIDFPDRWTPGDFKFCLML